MEQLFGRLVNCYSNIHTYTIAPICVELEPRPTLAHVRADRVTALVLTPTVVYVTLVHICNSVVISEKGRPKEHRLPGRYCSKDYGRCHTIDLTLLH